LRDAEVPADVQFQALPEERGRRKALGNPGFMQKSLQLLLSSMREKDKVPSRFELQAQLPRLKREKPELNKVHSKVLQMVLYQLYSNLKALSQLKEKGKRVGMLRFKQKGGTRPSSTTRVVSSS
jgi:hypothetical protein